MPRPSANPLPEAFRECRSCHDVLPCTLEHFGKHLTCRGGLNTQCITCVRAGKRLSRKYLEALREKAPPPLKPGQRCPKCEGLTHRRPLTGCPRCHLAYEAEPPVELVTHRSYERAV
jgi:hypothetical protein